MQGSDPIIGKTIGNRYKVIEKLGAGGMGAVYKAIHSESGQAVALKIIRNVEENEERWQGYVKRFEREAKLTASISHPNAVMLHDYGLNEGSPFIVMEFIDGIDLQHLIETQAPVSPKRAVEIISQAAAGVSAAHELGILHRDLKPEHIMICTRGNKKEHVEVLDFGVAKPLKHSSFNTGTLTGSFEMLGTPQYMAPEQAAGEELDERADLYSLALIVYELLTGKKPFKAKSLVQLLSVQKTQAPPRMSEQAENLDIPNELEEVIRKALSPDRKLRPKSVKEFAELMQKTVGLKADSAPSKSKLLHTLAALVTAGITAVLMWFFLG